MTDTANSSVASALAALPIAFCIFYPTICIGTVVVAVKSGTSKSNKYPLVCAAGAHPPAYKIYSVGCLISAILLIASSIIHTIHIVELKPEASGFFWALAIVGCLAGIGIAAMGIIPMRDPYKTQHNIAGYVGIGSGCCFSGMLIGAGIAVGDRLSYPTATILLRLISAVVMGAACGISLSFLLEAEKLAKKRKQQKQQQQQEATAQQNDDNNREPSEIIEQQQPPESPVNEETKILPDLEKDTNKQSNSSDDDDDATDDATTTDNQSMMIKEQRAWLIAAWGQYVALLGVTTAVASLALASVVTSPR